MARGYHAAAITLVNEDPRIPFEMSIHATRMLEERRIDVEWVTRVIEDPQWVEPDRNDPQLLHALGRIPEYGERVLRVVYNQDATPWRVVTVYFDRTQRNRT